LQIVRLQIDTDNIPSSMTKGRGKTGRAGKTLWRGSITDWYSRRTQ